MYVGVYGVGYYFFLGVEGEGGDVMVYGGEDRLLGWGRKGERLGEFFIRLMKSGVVYCCFDCLK